MQNRFSKPDFNCGVQCVWADVYSGQTIIGDLDLELACVLYNIGCLHAELGALDSRSSADSMKVACTHFQCAAWAFQNLRDDTRHRKTKDMSYDLLSFFVQVMLAQAQECILEKAMLDNRKASIVSKVAAQVVEYYNNAIVLLLQSAINANSNSITEIVGSKLYKEWKKFLEFKIAYYGSICSLFMGNCTEEQHKMGERVAWYQSAEEKLSNALKLGKQLDRMEINEALTFVSDVISVKLNNAKKENDFVYHEKVPTSDKLSEVKGASLVKGIPFSVSDPEISGPDIFAGLVPIEAHETASIYSDRKDSILREVRAKIDHKNQELTTFMSALQIDRNTLRSKSNPIPDELIEICAAMSVNPAALQEISQDIAELESISKEVDSAIKEAKVMLAEEERKEKEHQERFGKRAPSTITTELTKELEKREDTHNKAVVSNSSLRENLEKHSDDIQLLINSSAKDIASLLPDSSSKIPFNEENLKEMDKLLEKVEEMRSQRSMLESQLRAALEEDNVLRKVLTHSKEEIDRVFQEELKKYDKFVHLLEQNMAAQENILRSLTKANAKYAETRRGVQEQERFREMRLSSLVHTHEVFKEMMANSKKGLEFYRKFQNIISRLVARIRSVSRVHDEERAQIANVPRATLRDALQNLPRNLSQALPSVPPSTLTTATSNNFSTLPSNIPPSIPQNTPVSLPRASTAVPTHQNMTQNIPQNLPQLMPQTYSPPQHNVQNTQQNIQQNLQNIHQNTPQSMPPPQVIPQYIPQSMPHNQTMNVPQNIPQYPAHTMPNYLPPQHQQNIPQSMPSNVIQNTQHQPFQPTYQQSYQSNYQQNYQQVPQNYEQNYQHGYQQQAYLPNQQLYQQNYQPQVLPQNRIGGLDLLSTAETTPSGNCEVPCLEPRKMW